MRRLIEQLGGETSAQREAAQQTLVKIGLPAVAALRTACTDKNAERAARAKAALEEIGKPSWPFQEFSVLMGTTGRWDYALTVKGDGAYTFALTRGGQTGYQTEHRLGQAHLARLVERLEAAAWLAQEGKVKTTMRDGTKYQMDLLRNDRWTSVVCYGPQGDAYAQLVRFLESVRHQETLQYRLSQGWAEAVPHIHMLDSELSALLGEGSRWQPSSPALDYLRLLDAVNALAQQGTDNQRKLAAGVAEKIRKVSATQFATPPASTRPATQPATQFVTAKNPLQVMEAAHKLMTGAREASDSARADLCQGPPDFALRDDVIVIQLPPANYPSGSNDSLMKVLYRPAISRFYLRYDMPDNLAAPYRGPFEGSPFEKLHLGPATQPASTRPAALSATSR